MMTSPSLQNENRLAINTKKITTLNDHEGQILCRRRIHTSAQKGRDKELARVTQDIEDIRQTIQMFSHDSSSNGANENVGESSTVKDLQQTNTLLRVNLPASRTKPLLQRTKSLPERFAKDKTKHKQTFPSLNEAARDPLVAKQRERQKNIEERDQGKLPAETIPMIANARSFREHKKLERSKTAPVALLQPLLKTTPEMVRTKIHISTSKVHGYEEQSRVNSKCSLVSSQRNSQDENPVPKRSQAPLRVARTFNSNDLAPHDENEVEKFNAVESKKAQPPKKIRKQEKILQKKERFEELVDFNSNPSKELHHCRFSQFAKERPEPNRI